MRPLHLERRDAVHRADCQSKAISMGSEVYDRDGSELVDRGLYIDHAPWHFKLFALRAS